ELGRRLHRVSRLRGPRDLAFEDCARGFLDQLAVLALHVTEHEGSAGQPWNAPHRSEVGNELHVTVATLPRRELEAGQRLHLHVYGEEIDAGMDAITRHVLEEVAGHDALAHETAIAVGENREHGVDLAPADQRLEGTKIETAGHGADSSVSLLGV